MNIREESLKKHYEWKGKIEVTARVPADTSEALSLAYTVDPSILNFEFSGETPIENVNALLNAMIGSEEEIKFFVPMKLILLSKWDFLIFIKNYRQT